MEYKGTTTLTIEQLAEWEAETLETANLVLAEEAEAIRVERKKIAAALSIKAAKAKVNDLSDAEKAALRIALG